MQGHGGVGMRDMVEEVATPGPGTRPSFVVRSPRDWWLMAGPDGEPQRVALADLLAATSERPSGASTMLSDRASAATEPVARPLASVIRPSRLFVGLVIDGGIMVENPRGGTVLVDTTGLLLLDALEEETTVGDLARRAGVGPEAAGAAVARLVAAGKILLVADVRPAAPGSDAPPGPVAETPPSPVGHPGRAAALVTSGRRTWTGVAARVQTAWRLSSKVRWVRSLLADGSGGTRRRTAGPVATRSPAGHDEHAPRPAPTSTAPRPPATDRDGRIPVYAPWLDGTPLPLALGLITTSARAYDGGRVQEHFDVRRPESAASVLTDLRDRTGSAVLLCSDYIWTLEANLEFARRAREVCPSLVIVHGGPSCPKYPDDAAEFLGRHGDQADILVRGEGEVRTAQLLLALAASGMRLTATALDTVPGLTFTDRRTGEVVRTEDGDRIANLDEVPSPYLSGEFDGVPREEWGLIIPVETNRGCPYGCTFCDWGQAIQTRVRSFDLERVKAEIETVSRTGTLYITDANFGMLPRDLEIAEHIADVRRRTGGPQAVYFTTAKKRSTRLIEIIDVLSEAGVGTDTALSLQTTDDATLGAVRRRNIAVDHYTELGRQFRRRGQPPVAELMLGLPGQTVRSFKDDLQFAFDQEFQARVWETRVLPNSPMNDPEYRERWDIHTEWDGGQEVIRSTRTFTAADRDRMLALRRLEIFSERIGVLRHVLRYLQWDLGLVAMDVVERLMDTLADDGERYPLLCWCFNSFKRFPSPPVGWHHVYEEVRRFLRNELDVPDSPALDTVLELQEFLMPSTGRALPASILLGHDYASYYLDATRVLFEGDGGLPTPPRPLAAYSPAEFTVEGDPFDLCLDGIWFDERHQISGTDADSDDYYVGSRTTAELRSPLMRPSLRGVSQGVQVHRTDLSVPPDAGRGPLTTTSIGIPLRSHTA